MNPIANYRKARGLTQADLARELGVNINSVQGWERGSEPRPKMLPKIGEVLAVDPLRLLSELQEWQASKLGEKAGA